MGLFNPPPLYRTPTALFILTGANLNSTSDQQFSKLFGFTNYFVQRITALNAAGAVTTAAGGIYPATAKGGTALVSAAQSYAALSSSAVTLPLTLSASGGNLRSSSLYFSLTTGQGSTNTCDLLVEGIAWN